MTPVGLPDDIGDLIRANGRQLLFQFPHDAPARRRIMHDRGAHPDQGSAREQQLQRVPAGTHAAGADDRHVGKRLGDLPHAPHRDRPDGRPGQAAVLEDIARAWFAERGISAGAPVPQPQ